MGLPPRGSKDTKNRKKIFTAFIADKYLRNPQYLTWVVIYIVNESMLLNFKNWPKLFFHLAASHLADGKYQRKDVYI